MKRKRKSLPETVHPDILAQAEQANASMNKHLGALREIGYYRGDNIPLDLSVLAVEAASIIRGVEKMKNGK